MNPRKPRKRKDLVVVLGPEDDAASPETEPAGFHILRKRANSGAVEAGTMRPLKQGTPILGEVLRLTPHKDSRVIFDAEVDEELSAPTTGPGEPVASAPTPEMPRTSDRPALVATDAYRTGWENIFGVRRRPSAVN